MKNRSLSYKFQRESPPYGFGRFIESDFLRNEANGLLPNDELTIVCEGSAAVDRIEISNLLRELRSISTESRHSEDLGAALKNQKFSDVTLSAGNKDLLAHKVILAARSPVFAAMFEHEMKEREQSRVDIADVTYEVLEEMLLYMYTGKSPNIDNMAGELLVASDKYDMPELKEMCVQVLNSTLTVANAVDLLVLADTYGAKHLKMKAIHVIVARSKDVILTPAWKRLSSTHPHLIAEAFETISSHYCRATHSE